MARDARCTMGPRHPRNCTRARYCGDCEAAEQCNSRSRPERERHEHGHERTPVEKPRPYRGHAANRNPARRKEKGPAPTPAARGPLSPTAPRATRPTTTRPPSKRPRFAFNNPLVTLSHPTPARHHMRARTESASARGICHDLAFSIARARPKLVSRYLD